MKKKLVRRPSGLIYSIAAAVMKPTYKKNYGLVIDNEAIKGIQPPFIALANHASNLDYITVGLTLLPHRMNYMASSIFFKKTATRALLNMMGAIEKHQFMPDIAAVKKSISVIQNGGNILIFPSAQVGYSGLNAEIDKSVVKLIKKLGVPVVAVHTDGSYLTLPKWTKQAARGRIVSRAFPLFSADEVRALSESELFDRITAALAFNDFEWQRTTQVDFLPVRSLDGCENVLHYCPKCKTDYAIKSGGERLFCSKCGYEVRLDEKGFFTGEDIVFDNITDWHAEIHRRLEAAAGADGYSVTLPVTLMTTVEGKSWYHDCGEGVVTLDKDGFFYMGTDGGETVEYRFPLTAQTAITHTSGLGFDFHLGLSRTLCFSPADKRRIVPVVESYSILRGKYIDK